MQRIVDGEIDLEIKREISRYGSGRPRIDLLPIEGLEVAAASFEYGTRKYALNDWRKRNLSHRDQARAAISHIYKYLQGEDVDSESGCEHLGNALARLLMLTTMRKNKNGTDDR